MHLPPIPPPPRQRRTAQHRLDPLHQTAGNGAPGYLPAGMDEIHRIQPAPECPALVQNPPALADLLDEHKRSSLRPGHQQHPPADALLLQIEQHLNGRKLTGKDWGHGERDGGPPQPAAPRQGWPWAHAWVPWRGKGGWLAASLRSPGARAAAWEGPPSRGPSGTQALVGALRPPAAAAAPAAPGAADPAPPPATGTARSPASPPPPAT